MSLTLRRALRYLKDRGFREVACRECEAELVDKRGNRVLVKLLKMVREDQMKKAYEELVRAKGLVPMPYVPIPALREAVRRRLRISRTAFDEAFKEYVQRNSGKVLLSPAPGVAKKGDGIRIGRVEYYYVLMRRCRG